jgi:DNA-binding NtrC family response regulator
VKNSHLPTVLVVDDEKNVRESIRLALEQEQLHVVVAHDLSSATRTLQQTVVDALVLDIRLGDSDGLSFFRRLTADNSAVPTIFISGQATLTEAAQAVKLGAFDFIEKPFSAEKITVTVKRCLEHASLKEKLARITDSHHQYIGESQLVRNLMILAQKVAPTDACVLIQGESGTGKELIANFIHSNSKRQQQSFVKVNCAAIPENLVESELFGHERGAFTGAVATKRGLFEVANRGTIFLDEIGDLSLTAQAKILRVLQSGEVQKLGSAYSLTVDVRVVCATHKDLHQLVADGSFRQDLFYRLNVVPIVTPNLRDRPEDIPLLTHFLLQILSSKHNLTGKPIDDDVIGEFKRYAWPGNVRELQNTLERMLILSSDRIGIDNMPEELMRYPSSNRSGPASPSALVAYRDKAERDHIVAIIKRHGGNVTQAAVTLEIGRPYLHKRMAVLGITKSDYQ